MRRTLEIRRNEPGRDGRRHLAFVFAGMERMANELVWTHPTLSRLDWTYVLSHKDRIHTGLVDRRTGAFEVVLEPASDPAGVWGLRIFPSTKGALVGREAWRQYVFVQHEPGRTRPEIEEIARRHAPILVFSRNEQYFPLSIGGLLTSPTIAGSDRTVAVVSPQSRIEVPLSDLGAFMRYNGHCDYLLDFTPTDLTSTPFRALRGGPDAATVYYSWVEDAARGRTFLNYHMLYAFDTKTGIARAAGVGPHVFDRESLTLELVDGRPVSLICSGHLEGQRIAFEGGVIAWSEGRVSVPFEDPATPRLGDHPVVAVAEGSHALYPLCGRYQILMLEEGAGHLAIGREEPVEPRQVVAPPSWSGSASHRYGLRALGLDRLTSEVGPRDDGADPDSAHLVFSGYWVDVPGATNARFPPFTTRERKITNWVDGAFPWPWGSVPAHHLRGHQAVLAFLQGSR